MTPDSSKRSAPGILVRLSRTIAGVALCPFLAYFLAYVILNVVGMLRGQPWHLFIPRYGIGLFSVLGGRGHQWSVGTVVFFYILSIGVALPLIAILRHLTIRHFLLHSIVPWGFACAAYFLFVDVPFGLFWEGAACGAPAGIMAGLFYYLIVYAPSQRDLGFNGA